MTNAIEHSCDTLIIGSGAAGLTLALQVAQFSNVIVLSKAQINDGSTYYAQGGIAAVFDKKDSIESHVSDTLIAGANLCDKSVVEMTAQNAKASLEWLIDCGADFDQELSSQGEQRYHLTKEGGHSHRRILHAADATGKEVQTTLQSKVLNHPNIRILERYNAVDLVTTGTDNNKRIVGAYVWSREQEQVETIHAQHIALATGGASKVYQYTSNPDVASGDGIAIAWRAGCSVANLEFNQFHPTSLYHPQSNNFLLSEALRGEGAHLKRPDGSRFMSEFDVRGELAPRDVVARAIDYEMKRLGVDCLYLDISHKNDDFIQGHFPTIYQHCLSLGIDITKEPMPVVPAAHYTCGGVKTDKHGATDIKGLYAIGEVAYTGLHGANRMASNSLLECLVFAKTAADHIKTDFSKNHQGQTIAPWDESKVTNSDEEVVIQHNWHELRLFMWDYVGIVRTNKRLARAKRRVELLQTEIDEYYSNFRVSNNLLELRNLVQVAQLIIDCAIARKESVGLHYNLDYPNSIDNSGPTILTPTR